MKKLIFIILIFSYSSVFSQDNISIVPVISEGEFFLFEFYTDTIVKKIPEWREVNYSSDGGHIPYPEEIAKEKRKENQKLFNEKILLKDHFQVVYIWGEKYVMRLFIDPISIIDFHKVIKGKQAEVNLKNLLSEKFDIDDTLYFSHSINGQKYFDPKYPTDTLPYFYEILQRVKQNRILKIESKESFAFYNIKHYDLLQYRNNNKYNNDSCQYNFLLSFNGKEIITNYNPINKAKSIDSWIYYEEAIIGQVALLHDTLRIEFPGKYPAAHRQDVYTLRKDVEYKIVSKKEMNCISVVRYITPGVQNVLIGLGGGDVLIKGPHLPGYRKTPLFEYTYIPNIAYYPSIFKIKSVNGKPFEDFVNEYCNSIKK